MLDPSFLIEFKAVTGEDSRIAELIAERVDIAAVRSIVEVGAGTGEISAVLRTKAHPGCSITMVEPQSDHHEAYPSDATVVPTEWQDAQLDGHYDLIIMSHVMGHFPVDRREGLVTAAIDLLTPRGTILIVTNAPKQPFWQFALSIYARQGAEYVIAFDRLEVAIKSADATFTREDVLTEFPLGTSMNRARHFLNAFFPKWFDSEESAIVDRFLEAHCQTRDGYVLPLYQRMYCCRRLQREG